MNIPLSQPDIGEREIEMVTRVLRSGRLSIGPFVEEFEQRFAEYTGRAYAVAVSSGTAALHLCVKALGIGPKDEVLTTPFTFVASANCLLYEGALPAFVDIDPATLNIDPAAIRKALERDYIVDKPRKRVVNKINGRTLRAILPVHVFGLPCDMRAIIEIAHEWELSVIEDACEALGAEVEDRKAGGLSHAAAFAFYPNKQMTTGEGGMIVTDDEDIARLCRSLRNQGRDAAAAWLRHEHMGYNYRLSEIHAALGLAQLERLDDFLEARAAAADTYSEFLSDIRQIALPWTPPGMVRSWFAYVIQLKGPAGQALRNRLILGLHDRGIGCQAYFPAVHLQPYLENVRRYPDRPLAQSRAASECCLALPLFSTMTRGQVEQVCFAVREILFETPTLSAQPQRATARRVRGAA